MAEVEPGAKPGADTPEDEASEAPKLRFPRLLRRGGALLLGAFGILIVLVLILRFVAPPTNIYQWQEARRLGPLKKEWVALDTLPAHVSLAAIAAEDSKFCSHWGFDLAAIRAALADGARRGGSTISQQTAKNVFLWQGRSWVRKGLEVGFTGLIEALWGKHRILEVYLNVAEFDTGVFGIEAAARHHFGVPAARLSPAQAAVLMAVLPDPKGRSAIAPSAATERRSAQIAAGARTLAAQARGGCIA